jgi:phosphomannomutase
VKRFVHFWWDFVVGDDWRVAAGVVIAVAATAVLAHSGVNAWWLPPLATAAVLSVAAWR